MGPLCGGQGCPACGPSLPTLQDRAQLPALPAPAQQVTALLHVAKAYALLRHSW